MASLFCTCLNTFVISSIPLFPAAFSTSLYSPNGPGVFPFFIFSRTVLISVASSTGPSILFSSFISCGLSSFHSSSKYFFHLSLTSCSSIRMFSFSSLMWIAPTKSVFLLSQMLCYSKYLLAFYTINIFTPPLPCYSLLPPLPFLPVLSSYLVSYFPQFDLFATH